MIVMPANHTSFTFGRLVGKYPKLLGHLYGPGDTRGPFGIPHALDNGRYVATTQNKPWDEKAFWKLIEWYQTARWVVVPDVVGDRDATLREWDAWAPRLENCGIPLAMAVQDGMTPEDVPDGVVCFIGGTTDWKRRVLWSFCRACPRVHVGRINTEKWLWNAARCGAESCDGTGWFRGDKKQLGGLIRYLDMASRGVKRAQMELEFSRAMIEENDMSKQASKHIVAELVNDARRVLKEGT